MSDLQLALIAIGIAVVAAVFAYNKWQEARFKRQTEMALKAAHEDVLLHSTALGPTSRVEPTWTDDEPVAVAEAAPPAKSPAPSPGHVSEAIDYVVRLHAPGAAAGREFLRAAQPALARFRKRLRIEGQGAEGWAVLLPDQPYKDVRIGLQLVDRTGSVRAEDLDTLSAALSQAAAMVGAAATQPEQKATLETAKRLDAFCEQVDIQIAVHVAAAGAAFPGTKLRALAEAAGLVLENDGRFHRRDEQGLEIFALANEEAALFAAHTMKSLSTSAVVLELDVPRAPGESQAFAQMRSFAERLASGLGGVLVDDNRARLDAAAFEAIGAQLAPVYDAMRAQGIPAGSPLALRLFA